MSKLKQYKMFINGEWVESESKKTFETLNPENNELIQGSIEDETHQIMKNIKSILNEAGLDFKNVVRSKIYLTDMNNFSKVNQVYGSYFEKNHEPARTTLEVSGLPLGVDVEIDMIAVV